MDYVREMLPTYTRKLPPVAENPFMNALYSCITCQPFGITMNQKPTQINHKPQSQDVVTIASLVEKLKGDHNHMSLHTRNIRDDNIHHPNHHPSNNNCSSFNLRKKLHKPCRREISFSYQKKHERFTPCETNKLEDTECSEITLVDSFEVNESFEDFARIPQHGSRIVEEPKVITAPPRKKRRSNRIPTDDSTDCSFESNINSEIWNNNKNLELSHNGNLNNINNKQFEHEKPLLISTFSQINNNSNNIQNNHNVNNNKSGCSSIEVDSVSVERKNKHCLQLIREQDYLTNTTTKLTNTNAADLIEPCMKNDMIEYCENKIYYKNCKIDEYGNYCTTDDYDTDEVIVCESIIKVKPKITYINSHSDSISITTNDNNIISKVSFENRLDKIDNFEMESFNRNPFEIFENVKQQSKPQSFDKIIPIHIKPNKDKSLNFPTKQFVSLKTARKEGINWISGKRRQVEQNFR